MNTHQYVLREVAKFASGLVAGDLIAWLWISGKGLIPLMFFGFEINSSWALAGIVFDIVLLIVLIHYGWHANIESPSSTQRSLFVTVGAILGIVALAHLFRLAFGEQVLVGGWAFPLWLSWVGFIVAGVLSYMSFVFGFGAKGRG